MTDRRKTFVIDTSVLLYDRRSIHSFPGNDVIVPLIVLEELDRFKDKKGIVGENARAVNRYLDDLRSQGSLYDGISIEENQTIKVYTEDSCVPEGLDKSTGDNKIIGIAHNLHKMGEHVVVVTKDINFRVKCDALGIPAEDYYKDSVPKGIRLHSGQSEVCLPSSLINEIHSGEPVPLPEGLDVKPNEFVLIKSHERSNHSTLAMRKKEGLKWVDFADGGYMGIKPRNKEQKFALSLLTDPNIPLVTLTGIAGSGKTFLTLMSANAGLTEGRYKRIVISRPIVPVGRDLGFLPGDLDEKMAPWITPIADIFRDGKGKNSHSYFETMKEKGDIEIAPLSYIRGRTFDDCFVMIDEAQNATIHELKTVITRMGNNSKLVLLGDTDQVDTPYIDTRSNGLSIVIERFKEEWLSGHIRLPKGERSDLATIASRIL